MIWDGLIALLFITLAVAGWTVGIVNSWRGPIAIVVATLVTQQFYVDFATWIVQQLRLPPNDAVAIGYVLLWGLVEIVTEIVLTMALQFGSKHRPLAFERVAGSAFGLIKGLIVVILPLMTQLVEIKVPTAPPDPSKLIVLMDLGIEKSVVLKSFSGAAKGLLPLLGPLVVSTKEPTFKPTWGGSAQSEAGGEPAPPAKSKHGK